MTEVKPFISVAMITYNQEEYVAQALDSILNQEYPGKYEIIIGDDYSKDNTRQILLEYQGKYPDSITLLFNERNVGLIDNYFNVIKHCSGDYIMQCAGDDYWLPNKVAIQSEYILKYPDYGLFCSKAAVFNNDTQTFGDTRGEACISFDDLIEYNRIVALSVCFKKEMVLKYISEINPQTKKWLMEDYPFWLWMSKKSKLCFIDTITCVYRIVENTISRPNSILKRCDFDISTNEIRQFYCRYFSANKEITVECGDIVYRRYLREAFLESDLHSMQILLGKIKKFSTADLKYLKYMILMHSKLLRLCYNKIAPPLRSFYRMLVPKKFREKLWKIRTSAVTKKGV